MDPVAHLIFDIETVADGELIAACKYPETDLTPIEAIARFQEELVEQSGKTFVPYTYQIPTAIVIAKLDKNYDLIDLVSLDEPEFRPHVMTDSFWRGWESYGRPQWITFNGRGFDLPVMELAAFRYGLSVPNWFKNDSNSYSQPRNRFNVASHFDLQEFITNSGATWFRGGLDLLARLLGKPGKMDVKGEQVQEMYNAGQLKEISDYCRCDVLDTYFVFLRVMVMLGRIDREREKEIVKNAKCWLETRQLQCSVYESYLGRWTDRKDPWEK
jgi:3'-5' exonuclease